jgi:signal transduction histidine kinase
MNERLRSLLRPAWSVPLLLVLFSQWELWLGGQTNQVGPRWVDAAASATAGLLLIWRRRTALLVQVMVVVVVVPPWLVWGAPESAGSLVIGLVATYAVGRWETRPLAYLGLPVSIGWAFAQLALDPLQASVSAGWGWALWGVAIWGAGAWARQQVELGSRRVAEQRARSRAELAEQRLRIARDLHDVLANRLGVMVVHSEAAEELLGTNPHRAAEAMRRVQDTGRDALREVRMLLAPLRQQRVGDVDGLIAQMRTAGLPVDYALLGEPSVDDDIAAVVYRLLQEGLTNVVRHAGLVTTHAVVRVDPDAVTVEVKDEGPASDEQRATPVIEGNGIVGMRERVQGLGGSLIFGHAPQGGFALRAVIPLHSDRRAPVEPAGAAAGRRGWRR